MLEMMLLAGALAAAQPATPEGSFRAWRGCIGETTRVSAHLERLPEEMPRLLRDACSEQRARYVEAVARQRKEPAGASPSAAALETVAARTDVVVNDYVRRYAIFYTTGLWPER